MSEAGPPRLPEWLLRQLLPPGVVGDSILGDGREEYAAYVRGGGAVPVLWYWLYAVRTAVGYIVTRGRDVEMGTLLKDLKYGARSLMRMPGSAAVAVVVLAIGIGLCSFMFSLVYGIYGRGIDVPDAHEVFFIYETRAAQNDFDRNVPIQNFVDWRERQTSFEGLSASYNGTVNISSGDEPLRFSGTFITANGFSLLGVEPIIGRGFAVGDDAPGAALDVVLGYAAWRDRYGMDRSVIGRPIRVNGEPATILGVMPEGFEWPNNSELWVPCVTIRSPRRGGRAATSPSTAGCSMV